MSPQLNIFARSLSKPFYTGDSLPINLSMTLYNYTTPENSQLTVIMIICTSSRIGSYQKLYTYCV